MKGSLGTLHADPVVKWISLSPCTRPTLHGGLKLQAGWAAATGSPEPSGAGACSSGRGDEGCSLDDVEVWLGGCGSHAGWQP